MLQALRPLLPNAWFFTTDLDALLLHPTEQKLTRNLLVASSFGLQLRPDIQGEIPPFRSSYQTAAFLATRVAIHSDEAPRWTWLQPPLLFEIGNSRTFQFAGQTRGIGSPIASESVRSDHEKCKADLSGCDEVQALASAMYPQASLRAVTGLLCLALVIGLGLALTLPSPRSSNPHLTTPPPTSHPPRFLHWLTSSHSSRPQPSSTFSTPLPVTRTDRSGPSSPARF